MRRNRSWQFDLNKRLLGFAFYFWFLHGFLYVSFAIFQVVDKWEILGFLGSESEGNFCTGQENMIMNCECVTLDSERVFCLDEQQISLRRRYQIYGNDRIENLFSFLNIFHNNNIISRVWMK